MSMSLNVLQSFEFERVLHEDPVAKSVTLLGTLTRDVSETPANEGRDQAIIRIEKAALDPATARSAFSKGGLLDRVEPVESTDIYSWVLGWFSAERERDVKINIICPATDVHIKKYSAQKVIMIQETPALYEQVVVPYMASFPPARIQWVRDILSGVSEVNKILYNSPDYIILPDMKWDLTTLSAFYILAIARDPSIRSLRDLRGSKGHVDLLQSIRTEAGNIAEQKYGLERQQLRMFIHYQPSYYHFHVHIVHAEQVGTFGSLVGQAHLLDDVISLLEIDGDIFERMTLTYGLGDQHGLYASMAKLRLEGGQTSQT